MDCQNCGAPMTFALDKGHFICEHCGSLCFPPKPEDGVVDLGMRCAVDCPVCGIPLLLARASVIQVLYCQRCRGVLIPVPAFWRAVEILRATATSAPIPPPPINRADLRRTIDCPHCGRAMHTHPYGGPGNIVIDNCPHCEVNWLDYGEFNRIIDAPGKDRRQP